MELLTEKPPHNHVTRYSPISGRVDNKFVITVAPHKLIWPQGKIYPKKAVIIIHKNKATPENHKRWRGLE